MDHRKDRASKAIRPAPEPLEGRALLSSGIIDVRLNPGRDQLIGITQGSEGAAYALISGTAGPTIGRIMPSGGFQGIPLPGGIHGRLLPAITTGPDGNVYFAESGSGPDSFPSSIAIGQITPKGTVRLFPLPPQTPGGPSLDSINAMTPGPDGAVWFTDGVANRIGRISSTGAVTEFALPPGLFQPDAITVGPDKALWFTSTSRQIGRITTAGSVTSFALPPSAGFADSIVAGPDGNLWLNNGRLTTRGVYLSYPGTVPGQILGEDLITASDGAVWGLNGSRVFRRTADGGLTTFDLPGGVVPTAITAGPNGGVWYTQSAGNSHNDSYGGRIGRVLLTLADRPVVARSEPLAVAPAGVGVVASFAAPAGTLPSDYEATIATASNDLASEAYVVAGPPGRFNVLAALSSGYHSGDPLTVRIFHVRQLGGLVGGVTTVVNRAVTVTPPVNPTYQSGGNSTARVDGAGVVTLGDSVSEPAGNHGPTSFNLIVDWGDGTRLIENDLVGFHPSSPRFSSSLDFHVMHRYRTPGVFTIRYTLTERNPSSGLPNDFIPFFRAATVVAVGNNARLSP